MVFLLDGNASCDAHVLSPDEKSEKTQWGRERKEEGKGIKK